MGAGVSGSTYQFLTVEETEGLVTVTMNRPEKRNALSHELKVELRAVADALDARDDIGCVILAGAGPLWCAGNDVRAADAFGGGVPMAQARRIARLGADMCASWERLRTMTIAAVQGAAIGGGLSLAISCDFRILAPGTYLHAPEVTLGLNYTWNSIPRLANLVGAARTKLIAALARKIDAETALAWGLCEAVVDDPMAAAREMAGEIMAQPRVAQHMVKESVNRYFADPPWTYLDQDQILLMSRDPEMRQAHAEAIRHVGRKRAD